MKGRRGPGPRGKRGAKKKFRGIGFWDRFWMRRGRSIQLPENLHRPLIAFVRLGDGWLWIVVAFVLALVLPAERFTPIAANALLAAAISLPLYRGLKQAFRRERPYALFRWVSPVVSPRDTYSFPSGHTMNNLAVAASLALHLPWLWPLALALPVSIGLLRVLYGVHFVSDIVGGVVLGLAVAAGAHWLFARFLVPFF